MGHTQRTSVTCNCDDCVASVVARVKESDGLTATVKGKSVVIEGVSGSFSSVVADCLKLARANPANGSDGSASSTGSPVEDGDDNDNSGDEDIGDEVDNEGAPPEETDRVGEDDVINGEND